MNNLLRLPDAFETFNKRMLGKPFARVPNVPLPVIDPGRDMMQELGRFGRVVRLAGRANPYLTAFEFAVERLAEWWNTAGAGVPGYSIPSGWTTCAGWPCASGGAPTHWILRASTGCGVAAACSNELFALAAFSPLPVTSPLTTIPNQLLSFGNNPSGTTIRRLNYVTAPSVAGTYVAPQWSAGALPRVIPARLFPPLVETAPLAAAAAGRGVSARYDQDGKVLYKPSLQRSVTVSQGIGAPAIEFVRQGDDVLLVQKPGVSVSRAPAVAVLSEHSSSSPPPGKEKEKSKLVRGGVMAIKIYHAVTEVGDVVDAVYKALPGRIRRAAGKVRDYDKAVLVWQNLDKINIPRAIMNIITNEIEDRVVGRASRQLQKVTGRSRGRGDTGYHGPSGMQVTQFGRQMQSY